MCRASQSRKRSLDFVSNAMGNCDWRVSVGKRQHLLSHPFIHLTSICWPFTPCQALFHHGQGYSGESQPNPWPHGACQTPGPHYHASGTPHCSELGRGLRITGTPTLNRQRWTGTCTIWQSHPLMVRKDFPELMALSRDLSQEAGGHCNGSIRHTCILPSVTG